MMPDFLSPFSCFFLVSVFLWEVRGRWLCPLCPSVILFEHLAVEPVWFSQCTPSPLVVQAVIRRDARLPAWHDRKTCPRGYITHRKPDWATLRGIFNPGIFNIGCFPSDVTIGVGNALLSIMSDSCLFNVAGMSRCQNFAVGKTDLFGVA